MYKWLGIGLLIILLGAGLFLRLRSAGDPASTAVSGDPEARIIAYLDENVQPGRPVLVTELYNKVFTSEAEREALQRLHDAVFLIPATAAQIYKETGVIPTLQQLSDQFQFKVPGTLEVLLRVLESDPRVPSFFERDPASGEITNIYVDRIVNEERFGRPLRK